MSFFFINDNHSPLSLPVRTSGVGFRVSGVRKNREKIQNLSTILSGVKRQWRTTACRAKALEAKAGTLKPETGNEGRIYWDWMFSNLNKANLFLLGMAPD